MYKSNELKRIELKIDIQTFIDRLYYALKCDSVRINFVKDRKTDFKRDKKFANRYTVAHLFPDEDEVKVLKRELSYLKVEDYIETVKDTSFPNLSEMRVFGKQYFGNDVYIKIRVELISISLASGESYIFVMSFHFSEWAFSPKDFPYKKTEVKKSENC